MTDDQRTEVIEHAARAGRDQRWRRWTTVKLAVAGVLFAVLAGIAIYEIATTNGLSSEVGVLSGQQNEAAVAAQRLATQVRALGATPVVAPPSPVVPQPGPRGEPGVAGQTGPAGRGIVATAIVSGHLIIHYSDNSADDVGQVVGASGPAGRAITGETINNGHLVVSYSDNTSTDVGEVVGPQGVPGVPGKDGATGATGTPGRGVASEIIDSRFHLIVTYTDGSTADIGQLPPGAPPAGWTYKDALGLQHTCTRDNTDNSAPTYSCS